MEQHAERFTGRVQDYERYRLRYPAAVVDVLRERCGLKPEDLIADVGAGTGMLAEVFLEAGNRVIAVEPNAEMRAACERLALRFHGLQVVDAAAEATGCGTDSIDLVTVGRAFHWFDRERALKEFNRILKPGGWVVLASNRRDREGEMGHQYEAILLEHGTDYAQVRGGYRSFEGLRPYGEEGERFEVKMHGKESLTLEGFLGQTQSLSVTPMPGHAKYEEMQHALRAFFATWSEGGVLHMMTTCEVFGWKTAV